MTKDSRVLCASHHLHNKRLIGYKRKQTRLSPLPSEPGNSFQVSRSHARVDKKRGKIQKPGVIISIQQPEQNSQQGRDISIDHLGSTGKAPYEECKKMLRKVHEALPQIQDTEQVTWNSQLQRIAILQKINSKHLAMGTQISAPKKPFQSDQQKCSTAGSGESDMKNDCARPPAKNNISALGKPKAPVKSSDRQLRENCNSHKSSTAQVSSRKPPVSDKSIPLTKPLNQKTQEIISAGLHNKANQQTIMPGDLMNDSCRKYHIDRPATATTLKVLDKHSKPPGDKHKNNLPLPMLSSTKPEVTEKLQDSNYSSLNQRHPCKEKAVSSNDSLHQPPISPVKNKKANQKSLSTGLSSKGNHESASTSKAPKRTPEPAPDTFDGVASANTTEDSGYKTSKKISNCASKKECPKINCKFKSKLPRLLKSAKQSKSKADWQCHAVSVSAPGSAKKPRASAIPVWVGDGQFEQKVVSTNPVESVRNRKAALQELADGIGPSEQDLNRYRFGVCLEAIEDQSPILVCYQKMEDIFREVDAGSEKSDALYRIERKLFMLQGQISRELTRVQAKIACLKICQRDYMQDEG